MTLPASWAALLEMFRPAFRRRGTFTLFTVLATGMVAQTGRRSVVGMLCGARMAGAVSFHAACRFFSPAVWDVDRLGLAAARLIVDRLLGAEQPITVVIDDTLFKRWGRKVHHAFWTHDGAAQGGNKIARGNRWAVAGIVVRLPFCTAPVCLPVLFRLWAGKGTATSVDLAGELLGLIGAEFPRRRVHGVGDAAYHGKPLLVPDTTWTTRLPANAALYDLPPGRTGRRGRPALKGARLGKLTAVAEAVTWRKVTVYRYGRTESVHLAEVPCIWYGSFGNTIGRCVLVREEGSTKPYDLALFTTDTVATAAEIVERYAVRWSIEPSNATGKQQMGVGQARNRLPKAVERTVPFGMLIQSMVIVWYALHGYHPDDVVSRRLAQPWYDSKTEPSFEDMIIKLRETLIAARFSAVRPGHVVNIHVQR
ncbi:MAG: transposase [Actinobacteria bacterium]|nr:transposase [Actinomycetota bacterium]